MRKIVLFLFLVTVLGPSCKKNKQFQPDNPYGLPNSSQEGKNIFACRINGQDFIALNDNDHLAATLHSDTLIIGGRAKKKYFESILLQLDTDVTEGKSYSVNRVNNEGKYFSDSLCTGLIGNIYEFDALIGSIQLTKFDKTHKIVSGNFNLTVPVTNCDTLHITDGRFDIRYN